MSEATAGPACPSVAPLPGNSLTVSACEATGPAAQGTRRHGIGRTAGRGDEAAAAAAARSHRGGIRRRRDQLWLPPSPPSALTATLPRSARALTTMLPPPPPPPLLLGFPPGVGSARAASRERARTIDEIRKDVQRPPPRPPLLAAR